jgi:hypothetical protein
VIEPPLNWWLLASALANLLNGVPGGVVTARDRRERVPEPGVALAVETLEFLHRLIKVRKEAFL